MYDSAVAKSFKLSELTARNKTAQSSFQSDISGLRAISVLMVVFYHFNLGVFSVGFIGVDIFLSSPT